MAELVKMTPVFKDYLWGGKRLKEKYGKISDLAILAESWEISVHRDGESLVGSETLSSFLRQHPGFLGPEYEEMPLLVKFIDARWPLSVQVHPDETYAQKHENDHGKSEFWYVMEADEDASLYVGLKEEVTSEQFRQAVAEGRVMDLLNRVNCRKGDWFMIDEGTIHTLGTSLTVCEIQRSSNVTYRIYDYDRIGPDGRKRELHLDKALDVAKLKEYDGNYGHVDDERKVLSRGSHFQCEFVPVSGKVSVTCSPDSFTAIICLNGKGTINGAGFAQGDSFLASAGENVIVLEGEGAVLTVIACQDD